MADLEALQKDVDDAEEALARAARRRDEAVDKLTTARTASLDPDVVAEAKRVGVNPDNFDSDEVLQTAIDTQLEEHPDLKLPQEPAPGQTEADVPV